MSKHSAAPWTRDQYGTIKTATGETLRVNGVSMPCGGRPSDFEEVEANSNLVTAAPELLADLKWAAGYIAENRDRLGFVKGSPDAKRLAAVFRTLDKAEGI